VRNEHGEVETLWNGDVVTHGFLQAAGLSWHYAATGTDDAPPVLFLHGFPETWFAWHHQIAALGDSYRCTAIDLKGHGQSDVRLDTDYDYAAQAR
jgi:pimeloyl-ACP methyl ester carboxylesterase